MHAIQLKVQQKTQRQKILVFLVENVTITEIRNFTSSPLQLIKKTEIEAFESWM